ncbi:MAG: ABC transporter ATP-binding protein, partial [Thermodesulfobacteriota bacterium]|nr:ABC transporter ATP-binding protein [Thermodesulfobacteriota bacterium]
MTAETILEIKNLKTYFFTEYGRIPAVDGVDLSFKKGEILGLVGESGCGKSVLALSILGLVPSPPGKIVAGEVNFFGENLLSLSEKDLRKIRGNRISMIFQEPMTSLNPVFTIGNQIIESLVLHKGLRKKEAFEKSVELLDQVGMPGPKEIMKSYPHQLSGGMLQRAMIAMAISCTPSLLIADEPTTALDVSIQSQILDLLLKLKEALNMSIILITHDLGVVSEMADRVAVMYTGKIQEFAKVTDIFNNPLHPYTIGLLNSLPQFNTSGKLNTIEGNVPDFLDIPLGCKFNPRCPVVLPPCKEKEPDLIDVSKNHLVRCYNYKSYL